MKHLLGKIQYRKHNWNVCGYLKVIALLLGLQFGYTKFCCCLCEWDSRTIKHNYIQKQWPKQEVHIPGWQNVVNTLRINPDKVYLPPLHI